MGLWSIFVGWNTKLPAPCMLFPRGESETAQGQPPPISRSVPWDRQEGAVYGRCTEFRMPYELDPRHCHSSLAAFGLSLLQQDHKRVESAERKRISDAHVLTPWADQRCVKASLVSTNMEPMTGSLLWKNRVCTPQRLVPCYLK